MIFAEEQVFAKIGKRLLPILILCYFIAYLDRVNVGFAALTMNQDLGLTPLAYGWGAGIFFCGYFLFEVPSNIMLERLGARAWICRIMVTWGVLSMGMALVWSPASFFVARFLLGVAEAGFFPGVILYLTYWFPAEHRARIVGLFMLANPLATVIGAPISGIILDAGSRLGLFGLKGWQWLFLIEGLPSILLGIFVLRFLTDRPSEAAWLTEEERALVERRMARDRIEREAHGKLTLGQALRHPRVLLLGVIYFGIVASNYGLSFWLPQIVKAFGLTHVQTGFVAAMPYAVGALSMAFWGAHSDRTGERTWHVALPCLVVASALFASSLLDNPTLVMAALCVAGFGIFAVLPAFWTLPAGLLSSTAAAGGIALINSIGNLSGFAGPYMVGWIKDKTGSFSVALAVLSTLPLLAMILTLLLQRSAAKTASALKLRAGAGG